MVNLGGVDLTKGLVRAGEPLFVVVMILWCVRKYGGEEVAMVVEICTCVSDTGAVSIPDGGVNFLAYRLDSRQLIR